MNSYLSILKLFLRAKFIFKNPSKYEMVIFDDESFSHLKNFVYNYNFFVLQSRVNNINKIYFSFKILKYFLRNYNGNILTAYLVSLLEIISPKVVLTNIDNSFKFFDLARALNKKMNFLAIQGAARFDLKEWKHKYKKNKTKSDFTKRFYIPNFLCFGQFEIDEYKYYKIKVKNFFKVGSLQLANAFYHINKNKIKLKKSSYDICLVSEIGYGRNDIYGENNIEKGLSDMIKFTIKFCMKHNMKLIFAWKRDKRASPDGYRRELSFLRANLSKKEFNHLVYNSSESKPRSFSSYIAMFQSKVVVGFWSTLLRENLAIGGKILSCNLIRTNIFDFPIQGICSIKDCTFEEFEKRLLQIYSMSNEDYFSKINKDKCYAVEFDKKVSTLEILKEKIDYFLSDKRLIRN